jgi:hypothetical protein
VLITGPTYEAIDNVLLEVYATLNGLSPLALPTVHTARLRSTTQPVDPRVPQGIDIATSGPAFQQLQGRLRQHQGLTLVGATAQQAHRLLIAAGGPATGLFDLILVDEASQLDVATSTLPLAGLAAGGSVTVAGDPKQLPPIHQAEAPLDLAHIVGPVFTYFEERFRLQPCVLEVNYRSCRTIVELAYAAHYPRTLHAYSPDLRLDLLTALPTAVSPPAQWPANPFWTPEWASLLSPDEPTVCFIYPERRSSQWNPFEADAVASLVWLLSSRVGNQLQNELDTTGAVRPTTGQAYSMQEFWSQAVGIVTPHRAQQALIVSRLQTLFPGLAGQGIREAVDTVERFQGQERDIMLATFALGDPDAISDEDEFLLSLHRFNVMASRARAKLIVFVSQEVVDHLSSDMQVLRDSALLKTFAEIFCGQTRAMQLGYIRNGMPQPIDGVFRWRQ